MKEEGEHKNLFT